MKKAVVVHSGGMDSSLCLALAIEQYGSENILSLSYTYGQRHGVELEAAKEICTEWNIDHQVINIDCLQEITTNALTDKSIEIKHEKGKAPTTLVTGRNGLMARIAAIHAENLGAECIFMGVIEVEEANSGYRDCSRKYMDIIQAALRMDFDNQNFEIKTPLVFMTKKETMVLGHDLGVLKFLLEKTISCYEGLKEQGCKNCPACKLRNTGIIDFLQDHDDFELSYREKI